MKTLETELASPFHATTWRWFTPVISGAALGTLALAVPSVRELFQLEGLRWLHILLFAFLATGALTPLMVKVGVVEPEIFPPSGANLSKTTTRPRG